MKYNNPAVVEVYLYSALLQSFLQFLFGNSCFLLMGLTHVFNGWCVEMVQLWTQWCWEEKKRKRERHREWKTRLFQGDELLSGAELNIIHLQLSLKHRWKWKWHSFPYLQFPFHTVSLLCFPVSSNYNVFQWDWAIIRALDLSRT